MMVTYLNYQHSADSSSYHDCISLVINKVLESLQQAVRQNMLKACLQTCYRLRILHVYYELQVEYVL